MTEHPEILWLNEREQRTLYDHARTLRDLLHDPQTPNPIEVKQAFFQAVRRLHACGVNFWRPWRLGL